MKKFFSIMLTLCMCMALGTALTACDLLGDTSSSDSEHTHTYETKWSKDDTYHWYACEDDSCTEISQKAKHTFENNVCTVCLYEKTVVPSINEVTAEQFAAALSFESVTNVTIVYESNDEGSVYGYTTYFDGNKIKAVYDDSFEDVVDTIYEVDSQKLYGYWYMEENDGYAYTGWVKVSINLDDEMANATISGIESIRQMLTQINYSDCIYADNVYTITQTIDEVSMNFAFQFENGVLKSVRLSSTEGGTEYYSLFTFSDYGTTTVALPTEYKEFSEITPTPSSNWASYFDFNNVTVNTSYARTWSSPMELNVTDYYTMKVDDTEWSWAGDGYSYETLYFDGTNTYIDGLLSEDEYSVYNYIQNIGGVEMFALYESCFVETSAGVYYAEEIAAICPDGLSPLQNIKLVIVDGKMQSVTYGYTFSIITPEYTEIYTAVVEHTFSNWGETIVEGISMPSHTCLFEEIVKDEFLKAEATCTTATVYYKSCDCGEISDETFEYGEPLGHSWGNATCMLPKTCSVCSSTEGVALGHSWDNATCTTPKTCSVCSATEGNALGHSWDEATCTLPKTCSVCSATEGTSLGHSEVIDSAIAATCTEIGLTEGKHCSVCDEVIIAQTVVNALGHEYENRVCTICGNKLTSEGLEYILINNGTEYEIKSKGSCIDDIIVLPAEYNGYPVTSIGERAFAQNEMNSVFIPDTVRQIKAGAFSTCYNLSDVRLPVGLSMIDSNVFLHCSKLEDIEIPDTVVFISEYAFAWCGLKKIILPNSVERIGEYSFYGCEQANQITMSSEIKEIGYSALDNLGDLQFNVYDNAYYIGNSENEFLVLMQAKTTEIIECEINSKTTIIYHSAFWGCTMLANINIPNTVVFIGGNSFSDCNSLIDLVIPSNVAMIYDTSFANCSSFESLTVESGNTVYYSAGDCIIETNTNTLLRGCKNSVIADDILHIGNYAFSGCDELDNLNLPSGLVSIGKSAFANCSRMEYIELPDSVEQIGSSAFFGCVSLKRIEIPSKISVLNSALFYSCENLDSIMIPISIIEIQSRAFNNCDQLTTIYYGGIEDLWYDITDKADLSKLNVTIYYYLENEPELNSDSTAYIGNYWHYVDGVVTIWVYHNYIVHEAKEATCTEVGWDEYVTCTLCDYTTYREIPAGHILEIYEGKVATCTESGWEAYETCSRCDYTTYQHINALGHNRVTFSKINATCTSTGRTAYDGCSRCPYRFTEPTSIAQLGHSYGEDYICVRCGAEYFTEGLEFRYDYAFNCYVVAGIGTATDTQIVIPSTYYGSYVKYIDENAFAGCDTIESVRINAPIATLTKGAFRGCNSLKSIYISKNVKSIGAECFYYCTELTTVVFESDSNLELIGTFAFEYCYALKSFTIPASVNCIERYAFGADTIQLESVIFENPNNWYRYEYTLPNDGKGVKLELNDPERNAEWLRCTYDYYVWRRTV